uniref:NEU4 protein n=1 Tax=Macrostomum lignano TaxID=282301 RepID=A0A1I8F5F7_9PLAT
VSGCAAAGGWRCGSTGWEPATPAGGHGRGVRRRGTEDRDALRSCLRAVSPRPVNDGAWHGVLLRATDGWASYRPYQPPPPSSLGTGPRLLRVELETDLSACLTPTCCPGRRHRLDGRRRLRL